MQGWTRQFVDFALLGLERRVARGPAQYASVVEQQAEERARGLFEELLRRLVSGATGGGGMDAHWGTVVKPIRHSIALGQYEPYFDYNLPLLDPTFGLYYNAGLISYSAQFGREARIAAVGQTPAVQLVVRKPGTTGDEGIVTRTGDLVGDDDVSYAMLDNTNDLEFHVTVTNPSDTKFKGNVLGYIYTGHGRPFMVESPAIELEPGAHMTVSLKGDGLRA